MTLTHLVVLAIAVGYPAYAVLVMRRIRPALLRNDSRVRRNDYWQTITILWGLVALMLVAWLGADRTVADLGLARQPGPVAVAGLVLAAGLAGLAIWYLRRVRRDSAGLDALRTAYRSASGTEWLPHDHRELTVWLLLSFTAGITEELLYRGFLMAILLQHTGMAGAVVVSSVVFGLAHAYQGLRGVLATTAAGVALAVLMVATGSLWVPIVVHIAMDAFIGWHASLGLSESPHPDHPLHGVS